MEIRIVKSKYDSDWYRTNLGATYEVSRESDNRQYYVVECRGQVRKTDCVVVDKYTTKPIESFPQWMKDIPQGESVECWVSDGHKIPNEYDYKRLVHSYDEFHRYVSTSGYWKYATPVEQSVVDPVKEALQKRLLVAEKEIGEVREALGKLA
jgi:hypothetical protein